MTKALIWLRGKKTYVVAAAAILTAFSAYLSDKIDIQALVAALFAAIAAMTMRAGVKKAEPPAK